MNTIYKLPSHEAHKIAAGQVVDRPANVVKELVENSIDAGATAITVHIEDGGKQCIRVVDNGHGMNAEDAQLCFEKHATSKIRSVDELPTLTTFGFRGEALASIAAVAQVTLLTKQKDQTEGICIIAQDGTIAEQPAPAAEGTDITVRNLFYNVPARAKFLKKRETETRHIVQIIQSMSLAYTHLNIQLKVDGKSMFNCPGQDTIIQRFMQLWDHNTSQNMIPIEGERHEKAISITGAISNHHWFRYDRSGIFFLVNNRWVTNYTLSRALLKGYDSVIPAGRFPMACIAITIDPSLIDVNTHPRKEEVAFAHPRVAEQLITDTVRKALETHLSSQIKRDVSFAPHTHNRDASSFKAASYASDPSFDAYIQQAQQKKYIEEPEQVTTIPEPGPMNNPYPNPPEPSESLSFESTDTLYEKNYSNAVPKPAPLSTATVTSSTQTSQNSILEKEDKLYTLIGQFHKTYILIEQEEGLYLIDQHAAHERILYELFATRFEDVATINLMFPQLISCNPNELELIEPYLHLFKENGIVVESFGHNQLIIQSTPVHLKNASLQELVKQVIGWIKEYNDLTPEECIKAIHDKLRAQMACKAAVKAGDVLTTAQMEELLNDLYTTPNRFNCPHGRPTGWSLSVHEIEKKFRRKT